jgi:hypothetical protein
MGNVTFKFLKLVSVSLVLRYRKSKELTQTRIWAADDELRLSLHKLQNHQVSSDQSVWTLSQLEARRMSHPLLPIGFVKRKHTLIPWSTCVLLLFVRFLITQRIDKFSTGRITTHSDRSGLDQKR